LEPQFIFVAIRVWPPDWLGGQDGRPVDLPIDKYSTGMWPYEDMWGEDGGYRSNDERRAVAQEFFNEVRKGESLAFFYVDERNPMFVDTGDRSSSRGPNVKHQVRPQRQASGGTTQFRGRSRR
jgi:hypothetical protein